MVFMMLPAVQVHENANLICIRYGFYMVLNWLPGKEND